jgi:YfiH family protein
VMIKKVENDVVFFQFPHFAKFTELNHALFSKVGGCSTGDYSELNAGSNTGDKQQSVIENRKIVLDIMKGEHLVRIKQVHGTNVVHYKKANQLDDKAGPFEEADAVITNEKGVFLMIQTADCQAVMLYDPVKGVVGNIHSGWRGSIANIIGKTVRSMIDEYGTSPADIKAGIGPSLGRCCAEFLNYRIEIPEKFRRYKNDKDHFDFWSISRDQLKEEGVLEANIFSSNFCTKCNQDLFFSYRRDKVTGRLANVIGLK